MYSPLSLYDEQFDVLLAKIQCCRVIGIEKEMVFTQCQDIGSISRTSLIP